MRCDFSQWATSGRTGRGRVRSLIERIAADPAPWGPVGGLADAAAVSPRTFSRLFARETGMSPAAFVERARVRLSCGLLAGRAWLLGALARRPGFGREGRRGRAFHPPLRLSP